MTDLSLQVRQLGESDVNCVTHIHMRAFEDRALSSLGFEAVKRYYQWQFMAPHDLVALAVERDNELIGFCLGGIFRGALAGYLRKNRSFLIRCVLRRPWLILKPLFRDRLILAMNSMFGYRFKKKRKKQKTTTQNTVPSFGILAIATDPKQQHGGVGRLLMMEAERIAKQQGFSQMHLTVDPDNTKAITFYEGLNWGKVTQEGLWRGKMIKYLS